MMETFATSNDLKCDAVYLDKPVKESCPQSAFPFVLETTTKKDGTVRYCQTDDCGYKMTVDTQT